MSNEEKNIKEQNDMEAIKEMEMQLHEQFASNYNNGFSATITLFCTLLAVLYGYGYIFLLQRLLLATVMILNYDGKERQVTSIDHRCFSGCKELTSVKIPDGVTSLKQDCFEY